MLSLLEGISLWKDLTWRASKLWWRDMGLYLARVTLGLTDCLEVLVFI